MYLGKLHSDSRNHVSRICTIVATSGLGIQLTVSAMSAKVLPFYRMRHRACFGNRPDIYDFHGIKQAEDTSGPLEFE